MFGFWKKSEPEAEKPRTVEELYGEWAAKYTKDGVTDFEAMWSDYLSGKTAPPHVWVHNRFIAYTILYILKSLKRADDPKA